jgi:hypothetical protein
MRGRAPPLPPSAYIGLGVRCFTIMGGITCIRKRKVQRKGARGMQRYDGRAGWRFYPAHPPAV